MFVGIEKASNRLEDSGAAGDGSRCDRWRYWRGRQASVATSAVQGARGRGARTAALQGAIAAWQVEQPSN